MRARYIALAAAAYVAICFSVDWAGNALAQPRSADSVAENVLSGGETTVFTTSRDSFAKSAANLPTESKRDFTFGNKMFNTQWVIAPASVQTLDGLGPTFNRNSCASCHFKDGRGRPPLPGEKNSSLLVRLSIEGIDAHGGPLPHPAYGLQLNDHAIPGVAAEGQVNIAYEEIAGTYADGTPYSLRKPAYTFSDLGYGPLGEKILFSPRVAPAVHGLGLLESIPEETILGWADPDDKDGDGISGKANMVWDEVHQKMSLGRFGWKANVATLKEQDAGAAVGDMGITTSLLSQENCTEAQSACKAAPHGGEPEMSDKQLDKLTMYLSTLAVPARRPVDAQILKGARLFEKASCVQCHKPQARTGKGAFAEISDQDIQPFTDLLLHDMGEGLADGRPDFKASGREWRTPPLWGIGLIETVNKHTTLLHDGRARNIEEAILWHGGEAEVSKEAFRTMGKDDRAALVAFLKSL